MVDVSIENNNLILETEALLRVDLTIEKPPHTFQNMIGHWSIQVFEFQSLGRLLNRVRPVRVGNLPFEIQTKIVSWEDKVIKSCSHFLSHHYHNPRRGVRESVIQHRVKIHIMPFAAISMTGRVSSSEDSKKSFDGSHEQEVAVVVPRHQDDELLFGLPPAATQGNNRKNSTKRVLFPSSSVIDSKQSSSPKQQGEQAKKRSYLSESSLKYLVTQETTSSSSEESIEVDLVDKIPNMDCRKKCRRRRNDPYTNCQKRWMMAALIGLLITAAAVTFVTVFYFVRSSSQDDANDESSNPLQRLTPISVQELSLHNTQDDCWVVLYDDFVYDLTDYAHPGGNSYTCNSFVAGTLDGIEWFEQFHSSEEYLDQIAGYLVGRLVLENEDEEDNAPPTTTTDSSSSSTTTTVDFNTTTTPRQYPTSRAHMNEKSP